MNTRMRKIMWMIGIPVSAAIVLAIVLLVAGHKRASDPMLSEFGIYRGYSQPVYDGTQRSSQYLTLSDGTRLAYDLIIPTRKGVLADHPLPVLFKYTPYGRAWTIFDKKGKFLLTHTDGENIGLLEEYMACEFDIADSICPSPMTKLFAPCYPLRSHQRLWQ